MIEIICLICEKPVVQGDKILAFDEFTPENYQWENIEDNDGFDEVIPDSGFWNLAHYWCIFKRKEEKENE